jgi:hypothetical protein
MLRLASLLILVLVLPVTACRGPSDWMAGIDPGRYTWEPLVGTKHDKTPAQDLRACQSPGSAATPAPDAVTIARAEDSPLVEACMADKGYRKAYQPSETMF